MRPALVRLVLVTGLFLGWLGYLGYLVATRPVQNGDWPLVVSRPQILTSQVDLIAEIDDPHQPLTIVEVLWPPNTSLRPGESLQVQGIQDCKPRRLSAKLPPPDWSGPGRYLVPLHREEQGKYTVAPVPRSPGFWTEEPLLRIYPATREALAQYRQIQKPE